MGAVFIVTTLQLNSIKCGNLFQRTVWTRRAVVTVLASVGGACAARAGEEPRAANVTPEYRDVCPPVHNAVFMTWTLEDVFVTRYTLGMIVRKVNICTKFSYNRSLSVYQKTICCIRTDLSFSIISTTCLFAIYDIYKYVCFFYIP